MRFKNKLFVITFNRFIQFERIMQSMRFLRHGEYSSPWFTQSSRHLKELYSKLFLLSPDTFHVPDKRERRGPIRGGKRFFVTENEKVLQSTETKDARSENASFMYACFLSSGCY